MLVWVAPSPYPGLPTTRNVLKCCAPLFSLALLSLTVAFRRINQDNGSQEILASSSSVILVEEATSCLLARSALRGLKQLRRSIAWHYHLQKSFGTLGCYDFCPCWAIRTSEKTRGGWHVKSTLSECLSECPTEARRVTCEALLLAFCVWRLG